ncbi:MBL fold metallo-hydrolase [uncultured Pontibacter sp.]|uniref:MBL fold metallo-hydrolase n=1 Tax=uncultured Pontibacter sp. TaxID=453356 RepID=UPI002609E6E6|nr:MBL fold metallo-hydrolase [uncultured Pontibacter sp.]
MSQNAYGARPTGNRKELIKNSKNYRDGKFQNLSHTPSLAEGYTYWGVLNDFFFRKKVNPVPTGNIPAIKTNLKNLPPNENLLVWFGHSSYLLQLDGKTILVDPVLSNHASPFSWMNKGFNGTDVYTVDDLPEIDYLLISHDHYDHLDFETISKLKGKVKNVICGLGVGAHFEKWGYPASMLIEKDWGDTVKVDDKLTFHLTPARHYSGRGLIRNSTLWTSFVVETPTKKIYLGGDSGYDKHFAEIGERFGGFDLAILENGQYNEAWRYIHTLPDEVLKASKVLKAKRTFPVHSSKFNLGGHPWDEPLSKITELNKQVNQPLITPMIGQVVELDNEKQVFSKWWENVN